MSQNPKTLTKGAIQAIFDVEEKKTHKDVGFVVQVQYAKDLGSANVKWK